MSAILSANTKHSAMVKNPSAEHVSKKDGIVSINPKALRTYYRHHLNFSSRKSQTQCLCIPALHPYQASMLYRHKAN